MRLVLFTLCVEYSHELPQILTAKGFKFRVDFVEKAGKPLPICLDDLHWENFRISSSGLIFSVDHARTNFLPLAFRHFTFAEGQELAMKFKEALNEADSSLLGTLRLANGQLQLYNDSSLGKLLVYFVQSSYLRNEQLPLNLCRV